MALEQIITSPFVPVASLMITGALVPFFDAKMLERRPVLRVVVRIFLVVSVIVGALTLENTGLSTQGVLFTIFGLLVVGCMFSMLLAYTFRSRSNA